MFCLQPYCDNIQVAWVDPSQHDSFKWRLPLNNMCVVEADRRIDEGLLLFMDHEIEQHPNDISNGGELGYNQYRQIPAYHVFREQIDYNWNGWLDRFDTYWHKLRVKDMKTGEVYRPEELEIQAFHVEQFQVVEDDYVKELSGHGAYTNPAMYVQDEAYQEAIANGWTPTLISSQHNLRVKYYHAAGILMQDGTRHPSFGLVLGYRGETGGCHNKVGKEKKE